MCPRVRGRGTRWVDAQLALWEEPEERETKRALARGASVEREEWECALPRNVSAPEPEPEPEPLQWRAKYRGISHSSMCLGPSAVSAWLRLGETLLHQAYRQTGIGRCKQL